VYPFVTIEVQGARERLEDLHRDIDVSALLKPGVPGDADPSELSDLLAAQTGRPAATIGRDAYIVRAKAFTARAQEGREFLPAQGVRIGAERVTVTSQVP